MTLVAVLKGGISSEREVSLKTSSTIVAALKELSFPFVEIDAKEKNWLKEIKNAQADTAVIGLHGRFGEDGQVQKLLQIAKIPFTGSGAQASMLAMDKQLTKVRASALGLPVPHGLNLSQNSAIPKVTFPVVVKPNQEGSSFGVTIVRNHAQLGQAIRQARTFDQTVLVEEYLSGTEVTCGITTITGEASALPLVEIRPHTDFFNFEAKYNAEQCDEICPANIDDQLRKTIQEYSVKLFNNLKLRQYARADWIIKNNVPYFLEFNTLPGMTETSLITKELAAQGIPYTDFIKFLIRTSSY